MIVCLEIMTTMGKAKILATEACSWWHCFLFVFFLSRRSVEIASGLETYEKVLHHSLGFTNPAVVEFLVGKLGLSESSPPSLMRGLQRYMRCYCYGMCCCSLTSGLILRLISSVWVLTNVMSLLPFRNSALLYPVSNRAEFKIWDL